MNFFPDNYEKFATSNNYMKLVNGDNRVRILSHPIFGWEDWEDNKPVRFTLEEKPKKSFDPKKPVRLFMACIAYNYLEDCIQIMQITQATIRNSIKALYEDEDWGVPFGYDIKIIKSGEGKETNYTVNPVPHKPVAEHILQAFKDKPCNLEALLYGEDPFAEWGKYTQLGTEAPAAVDECAALRKTLQEQIDALTPDTKQATYERMEELQIDIEKADKKQLDFLLDSLKKFKRKAA